MSLIEETKDTHVARKPMETFLEEKHFEKIIPGLEELCTSANMVWVMGLQAGMWHPQPDVLVTPGAPQLFWTCGETITFLVFDVKDVLATGIVLTNVSSFFGTDAGQQLIEQKALLLTVGPGGVLYVPYGVMCIPLYYGCKTPKPAVTVLACMTLWSEQLWKPSSFEAAKSVNNANLDFFSTKSEPRWKLVEGLFRKYMAKEAPKNAAVVAPQAALADVD